MTLEEKNTMIQEKDFKIRLVLTHGQLTGPLDLPTLLTNYSESRILSSPCCLIDFGAFTFNVWATARFPGHHSHCKQFSSKMTLKVIEIYCWE